MFMPLRTYHILSIFLFFVIAVATSVTYAASRADLLTVAFLDVGQGDAIYIRTPNGNDMLVDGGKDAKVLRELGAVMPFGDRSIDAVVATHPDADHVGGFPDVFARYEVKAYIEPGSDSETSFYEEVKRRVKDEGLEPVLARRGMRIDLGDGVVFDIFFPDRDVSFLETNTSSIVGKLSYGEIDFLLTGDSPRSIEDHLVRLDEEGLRSEVLKAGHHGSRTSSGESFVEAVAPIYAVISSGKDNNYGHPHEEVTDTFKKFGVDILNTAEEGRVVFKTDGVELSFK